MNQKRDLLSQAQISKRYGIPGATVRSWVRRWIFALPDFDEGGKRLWDASTVERWLAARRENNGRLSK